MGEAGFRINPTLKVLACELAGDVFFSGVEGVTSLDGTHILEGY